MDRAKIFACVSLLLAACGRPAAITVGSKNFTEQVLLGEIVAQQIERRLGVSVTRKLDLGGTMLAQEALIKGDIDLYPEYTGTALAAVLERSPERDAAAALAEVRAEYERRWRLAWLPPLGFNNTFAMMVRREEPANTLSQAAAARAWSLGVGYEFEQRRDGLAGLQQTYGLRLSGPPITMDLGLLYQALESRKVDMIAANSTDGLAVARPVKILADDRRYFPAYECAVVVRESVLAKFPRLRGVLEELSGKLSDERMRQLNYEVDGRHRPAAEVAAEFLRGISAAAGTPNQTR